MKRLLIGSVLGLGSAALLVTPAFADTTGNHGQPSQSCQNFFGDTGPLTPGGFNTAGFNHATTVYAGAQSQNSNNPSSVSQYDVACFQAASH